MKNSAENAWYFLAPIGISIACGASGSLPETDDPSASFPHFDASISPSPTSSSPSTEGPEAPAGAIPIPKEAQRTNGDPARGYRAVVNEGYISLGIPWSGFSFAMTPLKARDSIPGREGKNALVGYANNVMTNRQGMELAVPNCLACHAARLNGKLFVGLGNPAHLPAIPSGLATNQALVTIGLRTPSEFAEYQEYTSRILAANSTGILFPFGALAAHRDPQTLAWSSIARFDAHTNLQGWVDVPPWWRTKKKNGLYANGMGRGDHVGHMMNMSVFSVQDVAEAEHIETMFVDIAAYLRSIEPPKFPYDINKELAAQGEKAFIHTCAPCHGTYGSNESYPNLLIPVEMVGTDPSLAENPWPNADAVAWFKSSYYGKRARLEPARGYVAPPLDGIWATAPFFHNGSVPTLEAVIDPSKRPSSWSMSFDETNFDPRAAGWSTAGGGPAYDTTQPGLSNQGHKFGEALSSDERLAVLEYLKTL